MSEGKTKRVGLVCTNKMRKGSSNDVLRRALADDKAIFEAWSDVPWHDEKGAAVRVSIICFAKEEEVSKEDRHLDGEKVVSILPDLTARTEANEVDLNEAKPLSTNVNLSFKGFELAGEFDPPEEVVRIWLEEPNASGLPNSDVLRPLWNGRDLAQGWAGRWLIDFGTERNEHEAALYHWPFAWVEHRVRPARINNREAVRREKWWREGRSRPELRKALVGKERFLVTPETARFRWFRWLGAEQAPEHKLVVVATDEDYVQGILSSHIHLAWAERMGNWLGVGNDSVYAAQKTLLTFPFPSPEATDAQRGAIADAARELNDLRERWLNPPEWTQEETLVFPATVGGPGDRWIPRDGSPSPWGGAGVGSPSDGGEGWGEGLPNGSVAEAHYVRRVARPGFEKSLAARTLTKLYNERPAWLRNAHAKLDAAVAEAYNLPADLPDADLLAELLRLNLLGRSGGKELSRRHHGTKG